MKDLIAIAGNAKHDDFATLAHQYFLNIRSKHHIIGSDYSYICECNYNKKSFVHCSTELSCGFMESDTITSADMLIFIESIVPNFPPSIVLEAALLVDQIGSTSPRYLFRVLLTVIQFLVLYDEWLKRIDAFFRDESAMNFISSHRLRSKLEELDSIILPLPTMCRPSIAHLQVALIELYSQCGDELSFEIFKKALVYNQAIISEMYITTIRNT
jgi:hypothetical protein